MPSIATLPPDRRESPSRMERESTCWTLIQGAARGVPDDVDAFVRLYAPVVRSYLAARWPSPALRSDQDDAVQDVFVECFKKGGVLDRAGPEALGSFRAFLLGVVRNVALRFETRHARQREIQPSTSFDPDHLSAEDERLSVVFDRGWARALLREAVHRQAERARILGPEAEKRLELLRLRFQEGLTLTAIAERWHVEPGPLRKQNARALAEFEDALRDVVAWHAPGTPAAPEQEMARILSILA